MAAHAGVGEDVFCELFASAEECYRAAYEEGLRALSRAVSGPAIGEQNWLEQLRAGLVAILGYFDDEPSWARLLVLETPLDTALAFECRRRLHELLAALLEPGSSARVSDGRGPARAGASPNLLATLAGELVIGGVFSVIRTNMLEADGAKLVELAPSLMAFIVAPYLGQAAAQAELEGRPWAASDAAVSEPSAANDALASESAPARARAISRASELPIRVTHRTTMVLRAIAQAPYSNNREVAEAAGLTDEGQTSKLLARLERRGVIENVGVGAVRGEPNAWLLTPSGKRALELLAESFRERAPRRGGRGIRGAA